MRGFGFRRGTIRFFRPSRIFGPPFLIFNEELQFDSLWWLDCNPFGVWGLSCDGVPADRNRFDNYVTRPALETPPYWYAGEGRELVQLYLKDGSVYDVTDYWFVNGEIHFTTVDEDSAKPVEDVIDFDELDLQTTMDVNKRRGFRFVMRDEPWQQFLKDHPDVTPPDVQPPKTN